jgi:hypothetical protein
MTKPIIEYDNGNIKEKYKEGKWAIETPPP